MTKLDEVPCKGAYKETIQPGDHVGYLTICAHQPRLHKGVYHGMKSGRASLTEFYQTSTRHNPETGEDLTDWGKLDAYLKEKLGPPPSYPNRYIPGVYPQSKLNPNWDRDMQAYQEFTNRRTRLIKDLEIHWHPATRKVSLQNNVMFKLEKGEQS